MSIAFLYFPYYLCIINWLLFTIKQTKVMTTQYPEIKNQLQKMISKNNDPKLITRWINRNFDGSKKADIKKIYAELAS